MLVRRAVVELVTRRRLWWAYSEQDSVLPVQVGQRPEQILQLGLQSGDGAYRFLVQSLLPGVAGPGPDDGW